MCRKPFSLKQSICSCLNISAVLSSYFSNPPKIALFWRQTQGHDLIRAHLQYCRSPIVFKRALVLLEQIALVDRRQIKAGAQRHRSARVILRIKTQDNAIVIFRAVQRSRCFSMSLSAPCTKDTPLRILGEGLQSFFNCERRCASTLALDYNRVAFDANALIRADYYCIFAGRIESDLLTAAALTAVQAQRQAAIGARSIVAKGA